MFLYTKYIESFYIEDKSINNQIKNLSLTKTFDLGLWGNNFTYSTNKSSITDRINYANTLGLDEAKQSLKLVIILVFVLIKISIVLKFLLIKILLSLI